MSPLSYNNVGTLLDRTTRLLKHRFQQAFKAAGFELTPEQWVLLDHLCRTGSASQTDIANGTFKDPPTVSRILDKLVAKGYAERTRFPNDRRRYQVAATAAGAATHQRLLPEVEQLRVQTWEGLAERDYEELTRILATIRGNFEE